MSLTEITMRLFFVAACLAIMQESREIRKFHPALGAIVVMMILAAMVFGLWLTAGWTLSVLVPGGL